MFSDVMSGLAHNSEQLSHFELILTEHFPPSFHFSSLFPILDMLATIDQFTSFLTWAQYWYSTKFQYQNWGIALQLYSFSKFFVVFVAN